MTTKIRTINELAWQIRVPLPTLEALAKNAVRHYRPFKIHNGSKIRTIDNPDESLKAIQKRLDVHILKEVALPSFLYGGVPGRSPKTHAEIHLAKSCVVRIDVRSFYPSITNYHVYRIWVDQVGCAPPVARLLTPLTTYRGHLPQGAPTSTSLANLVLATTDYQISLKARQSDVIYTRFVDDLVFSGDNPRHLINEVIKSLQSAGFSVSHRKVNIMPRHKRQLVTGYCVNPAQSPSVNRHKRHNVRVAIKELSMTSKNSQAYYKRLASIKGRIAFVKGANQGYARSLELYLKRVCSGS